MTVSADLQAATRSHIVGYIAIEGVEPFMFEYSDKGAPGIDDGWSRSSKVCLNPPSEFTNEINLGETTPQVSAMTFGLEDVKDADGTSYFGKMFATGRWTFNPHARVEPGTNLQDQINANADFIPLNALGALTANASGFITRESINWWDTNADGLLNVGKGLYPAINVAGTYGYTYARPANEGRGYLPHVGSVNFAMNGRRVAYYLTSWDRTTGTWNAESQSELIWTGRISNEIQYAGEDKGTWKVACISITDELVNKTPAALGLDYLNLINIQGDKGRDVKIYEYGTTGSVVRHWGFTIPKGAYTPKTLVDQLNTTIQALPSVAFGTFPGTWWNSNSVVRKINFDLDFTYATGGSATGTKSIPGKCVFQVHSYNEGQINKTAYSDPNPPYTYHPAEIPVNIEVNPAPNGETNHAFGALGFSSRGKEYVLLKSKPSESANYYYAEIVGESKYSTAYHPLHRDYNGSKLYVKQADSFWADQGDASTAQACVKIKDATLAPYWNLRDDEGNYLARYSARTITGTNFLTLTTDPQDNVNADGFVAQEYNKEQVEVQQVYIPHYKPNVSGKGSPRGPFELLLYPLLSSGTRGYNHAQYDKCPLDMSLAIQSDLVDIKSFLRADKYALGGTAGLGHRKLYVIDEPMAWMELLQRECKLFGYVLCWRKGKLTLRPVLHSPGVDGFTETLGDGTRANPEETPTVSMSTSTVVNQYACKFKYNVTQDKFGPPITITDVDSALSQGTKQVKIEHQGISLGSSNNLVNAKQMLDDALLQRWIRFPLPIITQTLAPPYVNRVFPGDIVKYTSSLIPDPYGSGTRTTSCLATVLAVPWDYSMGIGQTMLMLHDRNLAAAWAPAALVDRTAAGGGFDNAADQVKLVDYTFAINTSLYNDGRAVAEHAGWAVQIIERAPVDPTSPNTFGPWNTGAAYYLSNQYVQLPVGTDMGGWDASGNTEYIMTFADYPVINISQANDGKGTWQANAGSELLNDTNIAQVYK